MAENKREAIPDQFASIEEAAAFWDSHDLTDYSDDLEEIAATIALQRHRHLVALAPELAAQIGAEAKRQGVSTETLINLWLSERLRSSAA
ncbi:MAG TPA: CopG family antitoxin [Roseiflexaceae bacterium]|nr:CopG family antitoxin [Roseiflexaceae bacterium]